MNLPPESRAYRPHVTVGRFGRSHPRVRPRDLPPPPDRNVTFAAVTLYQSHLRATGPVYVPLQRVKLGNG